VKISIRVPRGSGGKKFRGGLKDTIKNCQNANTLRGKSIKKNIRDSLKPGFFGLTLLGGGGGGGDLPGAKVFQALSEDWKLRGGRFQKGSFLRGIFPNE